MNMKKAARIFAGIEDGVLIAILAITFLALMLQVVSRYVFNYPVTWTEELARYLQIWMTYLGLNFAIRYHAHIRITALTERLPVQAQAILEIVINLIVLACIFLYLPSAFTFYRDQTLVVSTAMRLPLNWIVLPLLVGFILTSISLIADIVEKAAALAGWRAAAPSTGKEL